MGDVNTPLSSMDRSSRQKSNKETQALNDTLHEMDLIDIYRTFHPKQQNIYSSQVRVECFPRQIIHQATKQVLINVKALKVHQASFLTTMKLQINYMKKYWKIHKYAEIKQHATKQQMSQRINEKRYQKIP